MEKVLVKFWLRPDFVVLCKVAVEKKTKKVFAESGGAKRKIKGAAITRSNLAKAIHHKLAENYPEEDLHEIIPLCNSIKMAGIAELMYYNGEDSEEMGDFELIENIYRDSEDCMRICWSRSVHVYKYGEGIKSGSARKKEVITLHYYSLNSYEFFCTSLNFEDNTYWVDADTMLSKKWFYSTVAKDIDIFVCPKVAAYDEITMSMLSSRLNFHLAVPTTSDLNNAAVREYLSGRTYTSLGLLDKYEVQLMLHENGLQHLFKQYLATNAQLSNRWNACQAFCIQALNVLNRTYQPSLTFSEAARRGIINLIVMTLSDFFQTTWCVEKNMPKQSDCIGWGKLDYLVDERVVVPYSDASMSTATIQNEATALPSSGASTEVILLGQLLQQEEAEEQSEEESEEHNEPPTTHASIPVNSLDIEAKEILEDKNFAQLAAQMVDLWIRKDPAREVVRGVLSNGRRWKFFSLRARRDEAEGPYLITMDYDGERVLHILRYDDNISDRRRLSGLLRNETSINAGEAEELLCALAASYVQ